MAANLCVESHVRNTAEHACNVITAKDATASSREDSIKADQTNFEFL